MGLRNLLRRFDFGSLVSGRHVRSLPSPQNAVDIFAGEWWSRFPQPFSKIRAGDIPLFEDPRIAWALSELGTIKNFSVLELGPLEGAHSYMLEKAGASSVLSIEASPRAYLKCLIVKEVLELQKTRFMCGDFLEYLRHDPPHVDFVCASGVLYHMVYPLELLALLSDVTNRLFLWTHYYDLEIIDRNRKLARKLRRFETQEFRGFSAKLARYDYGTSFRVRQFCGGSHTHANWLDREDILACLRHFGFNSIKTSFDAPDHVDGPAFCVLAERH